ncbi:MAG TPA: hypothetical protein VIC05_09615 [Solirubrobacteraceae bacterium]|jgi:hypothetical protein
MLRIRILLCALFASLVLGVSAFAAATPAIASHSQVTFFEAPRELLNPVTRPKTLVELQLLGVKALRVMLYWAAVAPGANSSRRPHFDAKNPASYVWGEYDALLAEAQRLKWPVLLTVTSPVPRWATSNRRKPYLTRPNDLQFKEFMTAVGRHYGSRVSYFAIWNEPNQLGWLLPQFNSNGTPASPQIYRGLFQAGYAGLVAARVAHLKVLMGETAPFGNTSVNPRWEGLSHNVAPLAFLRGVLCLDSYYHKARGCASLPAYGYAHHAYPSSSGPLAAPFSFEDVTIGVLSRLTYALNRAAQARAIRAHMPIFLTEFGINTKPNILGVSYSQQAEDDALSEKIAYYNPRVAAFAQYEYHDDQIPRVHGSWIGFQTGLETAGGVHKPFFYGFPLPLVVSSSAGGYSLWGLVRPARGVTKVRVLVQPPHSRRFRTLKVVWTNSSGYWTLHSTTVATHWRVSWRSPSGRLYNGPSIGVT